MRQKPPLFVAEISANHLGSLDRARELIKAAAASGADAVKFQTYTADTMTLNLDTIEFQVEGNHPLWGGRTLYELYNEAHTPWEWHPELFLLCRSLGVIPFSTPFDITAVNFLESLDTPMYKISSLETSDHKLIAAVARTGKPLIISTGATELSEINDLVTLVRSHKNYNITLLVCTSSYPADPEQSNSLRMKTLRDKFDVKVGLSDHTLGIGAAIAAVTNGAEVIEKHITLKRSDGGADGAFSMEPNEFEMMVNESKVALRSLGVADWKIQSSEKESRRLRRSLYIVSNVKKGEYISELNIRAIRPGSGCSPKYLPDLLGKKFKHDYAIGTPMDISFAVE
jgi:N-acetylneuraminate synthase